jgi:hypothetical protein
MNELQIRLIGRFYIVSGEYIENFKVGGRQKLRRIIGEDLFYEKRGVWFFNNPKICSMRIIELELLINKINTTR